jgi:hypothetical protein
MFTKANAKMQESWHALAGDVANVRKLGGGYMHMAAAAAAPACIIGND